MWFWFLLIGMSCGAVLGWGLGRTYIDQKVYEEGFADGFDAGQAPHPSHSERRGLWVIVNDQWKEHR